MKIIQTSDHSDIDTVNTGCLLFQSFFLSLCVFSLFKVILYIMKRIVLFHLAIVTVKISLFVD